MAKTTKLYGRKRKAIDENPQSCYNLAIEPFAETCSLKGGIALQISADVERWLLR